MVLLKVDMITISMADMDKHHHRTTNNTVVTHLFLPNNQATAHHHRTNTNSPAPTAKVNIINNTPRKVDMMISAVTRLTHHKKELMELLVKCRAQMGRRVNVD